DIIVRRRKRVSLCRLRTIETSGDLALGNTRISPLAWSATEPALTNIPSDRPSESISDAIAQVKRGCHPRRAGRCAGKSPLGTAEQKERSRETGCELYISSQNPAPALL